MAEARPASKKRGRGPNVPRRPARVVITADGRLTRCPVDAPRRLAAGFLLTPELSRLICGLLGCGTTLAAAAAQVGIGLRTLQQWQARGHAVLDRVTACGGTLPEDLDAQELACAQLVIDVERALSEVETIAARKVLRSRDWRAAAFYLERRRGESWGSRNELRVGALPAAEMSNEQLMAELRDLGFRPVPLEPGPTGAGAAPAAESGNVVPLEPTGAGAAPAAESGNVDAGNGHAGNGRSGNGHATA